ncbi:MAG: B12-binding domain-containing radical SAM protein [Thermodesulfobacteriota bacterium]
MKRILLLQLPLQGYDFFFSHENIPLASAYLKSLGHELGVEVEILPNPIMSYGSDQSILHYIIDAKPDVVGMSCYLWNIERSLFLAREIKNRIPYCCVILGGPEITPDHPFLLTQRDFDIGVVGEGEGIWKALLKSYPNISNIPGLLLKKEDGGWHFTGEAPTFFNLAEIPSPFLKDVLQTHLKEVLWMESVRGCLNRCAYCFYHKRYPEVRYFPLERIFQEVRKARDSGLKEVVFLDPCWNRHPYLKEFLEGLSKINSDQKIAFYAEGEAEGIDPWVAEKMGKAGFIELEVGLQTIKKETLRAIHRLFDPQKFLNGISLLQGVGIEVMVDLIAGLPGESFPDILESLDWVIEHEVYDSLMLYPLSLIPSTELYRRSQELGLKAMSYPPYLVTQTFTLNASEIHEAFLEYEKRMEEDIAPLEMPLSLDPRAKNLSFLDGLHHRIRWDHPQAIRHLSFLSSKTTYNLHIVISKYILKRSEVWFPVLRTYLKENPFTLLSIEVPFDSSIEELTPLWNLAREHSHPIDRDYTVTHTPYRSFLIFSKKNGLIFKWPDPREFHPYVLHDGQKISFSPVCLVASSDGRIPDWFFEFIDRRYSKPPEIRTWSLLED